MGSLDDARKHLAKARAFLDAAESSLSLAQFNAATSNAVVSGINSKEAICLKLTGRTSKSEDHSAAVGELQRSGEAGRAVAPSLRRLLGLKSKSQYQTVSIVQRQAEDAVRWAQRLFDAARIVVDA